LNIKDLQSRLKALGFYAGLVDGVYGPVTRSAVITFQESRGLKTDGIVGPITQAALKYQDAPFRLKAQQLADAAHINLALASSWLGPVTAAMDRFEINTSQRAAAFLANLSHESQRFSRGRENLNYTTVDRLLEMFGKRIKPEEAKRLLRNPEVLANRVYANRHGNGDEASGDGWRYRGGGPIGLTFLDNYRACEEATGLPFVRHPEIIEQPEAGMLSAGWFWHTNGLNALADAGKFDAICDHINLGHETRKVGDSNGYADRLALWKSAKQALSIA
jgi:putative chitinase